jgi:nucleoside-triphosphatase THEP1
MAEDDVPPSLKIGVIVRPPDAGVTDSMEGFARILQGQGYLVRGLVQRNSPAPDSCACTMTLVDIVNGQEFRISQDLGAGSVCCRIDTQAIADATSVLRQAVTTETDLLIVNKFGKLESQGRGMVDEMLAAAARGIPLLTSVEAALLERWREFTGGIAEELGPGCGSLLRWWEGVRPRGVPRSVRPWRQGRQDGDDRDEAPAPSGDQPFQRMEPIPETS